jgi:hypothetical protein
MEYAFNNTSLLWAYNLLNPNLGTAKAELWRLGVLFIYGGIYMDDDSTMRSLFDEIVEKQDKFIIAKEAYDYDDRCYCDSYPISKKGMELRYGAQANTRFFDGKFFLNWFMASSPGHPVILRTFKHIVNLIKAEYIGEPMVKMVEGEARGKLLQCVSTYSITSAARELLLEKHPDLGLHIADVGYREYGGLMKAWYSDYKPDHWVKSMNKDKINYLRAYLHGLIDEVQNGKYEGKLIMTPGNKQVFIIDKGEKRGFPDLATFVYHKYDFGNVTIISNEDFNSLPTGADLPHHD